MAKTLSEPANRGLRVLAALPALGIVVVHLYVWSVPRFLDSFMVGATVPAIVFRSVFRVVLFAPLVLAVIAILRPPRWVGRRYAAWVVAVTTLSGGYAVALWFFGYWFFGL